MSDREPDPLGRGPALAFPEVSRGPVGIRDPVVRDATGRWVESSACRAPASGLDGLRPRRFDLLLAGTFVAMTLTTVVLAADTDLRLVLDNDPILDVAVTSWSMLMAGGLALLTLPRYRDSGRLALLLLVSAFLLTAVYAAFSVAAVILDWDRFLGMFLRGPSKPTQLPLYLNQIVRTTTAILFLLAAIAAMQRLRTGSLRPRTIILAPIAIVAIIGIVLYPIADAAAATHRCGRHRQADRGHRRDRPARGHHAPGHGVRGRDGRAAGRGCHPVPVHVRRPRTGLGRLPCRRPRHRSPSPSSSRRSTRASTSGWSRRRTSSACSSYLVLLFGIGAEQRVDLRALRSAYAALDRLRVTEAERAALEERSRLAREIHDGLAQHLWFAKLKFERLATSVPEERQAAGGEVGQALDLGHRRGPPGAGHDAHQPRRRPAAVGHAGPDRGRLRPAVGPARHLHAGRRACRPPSRRASR